MSGQEIARTSADVWEVMRTASAVRRYRDEPVSDEVIEMCLRAASWAPSGGNQQPWKFVVLRSDSLRDVITAAAVKTWEIMTDFYRLSMPDDRADDPKSRVLRTMAEHMSVGGAAPVLVLFCVEPQRGTSELQQGGPFFPPCRTSCWQPVRKASARRLRCGTGRARINCGPWSEFRAIGRSQPYLRWVGQRAGTTQCGGNR